MLFTLARALCALLFACALATPTLARSEAGFEVPEPDAGRLVTLEELSSKTGTDGGDIWVALMGHVYDVTAGSKFYGPGNTYSIFAGRDATRAYLTGDFGDPEGLTDDLSGLSRDQMPGVLEWLAFYHAHASYPHVGRLAGGGFFDIEGRPTGQYARVLADAGAVVGEDEAFASRWENREPDCNARWTQAGGARVWCEGGRVPRLVLRQPGSREGSACRCLDPGVPLTDTRTAYEGCDVSAAACDVPSQEGDREGDREL